MACYHPQVLLFDGYDPVTKKPYYRLLGSQGAHQHEWEKRDPRDLLIPCRRCIGCRLDYSRRWADRLMLELDHSKTALFFTLTYDDEHAVPAMFDDELNTVWYTLVKEDLQLFNKRLRYFFPDRNVRFFAAGEYGDRSLRPHYHGIYFGLSLDDFPDAELLFLNDFYQPIYISKKLANIWKNGHVSIGQVSWQSCAYVARYNLKKLANGDDGASAARNCLAEFGLMSRNKGIGGYFFDDHPEFLENPRDKIVITDSFGHRSVGSVPLPSYLFEKLGLINPELYDKIKREKKAAADASFFAELEKTDLDEFEYLNLKELRHEKAASLLLRPLE